MVAILPVDKMTKYVEKLKEENVTNFEQLWALNDKALDNLIKKVRFGVVHASTFKCLIKASRGVTAEEAKAKVDKMKGFYSANERPSNITEDVFQHLLESSGKDEKRQSKFKYFGKLQRGEDTTPYDDNAMTWH